MGRSAVWPMLHAHAHVLTYGAQPMGILAALCGTVDSAAGTAGACMGPVVPWAPAQAVNCAIGLVCVSCVYPLLAMCIPSRPIAAYPSTYLSRGISIGTAIRAWLRLTQAGRIGADTPRDPRCAALATPARLTAARGDAPLVVPGTACLPRPALWAGRKGVLTPHSDRCGVWRQMFCVCCSLYLAPRPQRSTRPRVRAFVRSLGFCFDWLHETRVAPFFFVLCY